jgi:NTE family protein
MIKKLSIALGGGGTKGFAHIGVIKEILNQGYGISAIAGTSAGGIVGALFACGYEVEEIESFARDLDYGKLFSINISEPPSLLSLGGLFSILKNYIGDRTFDSLRLPFAVSTVDNNSGEEFVVNQGSVLNALKATTAVSGVFPPYLHDGKALVDGGVLNPVPVDIARWLNENVPVIAVSLSAPREDWSKLPKYQIPNYLPIPEFVSNQIGHLRIGKAAQNFTDSLELMMNMIAWMRLKEDKPDILITPEVFHKTMYDKVDVNEMMEKGIAAVQAALPQFDRAFEISRRAVRWIKASKSPGKCISL